MPDLLCFYLDEMVPPAVASGLQRRGIDALTTQEAAQIGCPDSEQLEFARAQGRVIFTMDEDFLQFAAEETDHPGIVFLAQRRFTVGRAVHGLFRLWESRSPESMTGQVEFL